MYTHKRVHTNSDTKIRKIIDICKCLVQLFYIFFPIVHIYLTKYTYLAKKCIKYLRTRKKNRNFVADFVTSVVVKP